MLRTLRYLTLCVVLVVLTAVAVLFGCKYQNSRDVTFPSDAELQASYSRAAEWVLSRREQVLNENNAMLWLFIREAAKASDDPRLSQLAQDFQTREADHNVWRFIFDSSGREQVAAQWMTFPANLPDYNRLFIYGATCNTSAREDPQVLALLNPSACGSTFKGLRFTWCRTHQLMGLRFIQRNHCEPDEESAKTTAVLQQDILSELSWDFRVEDAYIQRVMMLVESGRRQDVKAVWLRQILAAQREDGGWNGLETILELPGNRMLCWCAHLYPTIGRRYPSNLHATAQALYLLALWRAENLLSAGFLTEARIGTALGSE